MNANEQSLLESIDALVDEQLDGGEPETGYDFDDPDFPECPHCNRDWHGLAITMRIERMRQYGKFDVNYKSAEDDSPVLCPGSDFIGPWATPHQIKSMRHRRFLGTTVREAPWIAYRSSRDEATMEPARTAHNPRDLITHEMPDVLRYALAARNGRESLLREILAGMSRRSTRTVCGHSRQRRMIRLFRRSGPVCRRFVCRGAIRRR